MTPFPHVCSVTIEDKIRFWCLFKKDEDEHWIWKTGKRAQFYLQGKYYVAARVSYFFEYKIDPGELLVLHKCNNEACVNPAHLSLGTYSDNIIDRFSIGGDTNQGTNNPRAVITDDIAREIKYSSLTQGELAIKHGIKLGIIKHIRQGRTWKHI
jgi:hypothetical protein